MPFLIIFAVICNVDVCFLLQCFFSVSGDELISDTYPYKLVDDLVYEFEGKVKSGAN